MLLLFIALSSYLAKHSDRLATICPQALLLVEAVVKCSCCLYLLYPILLNIRTNWRLFTPRRAFKAFLSDTNGQVLFSTFNLHRFTRFVHPLKFCCSEFLLYVDKLSTLVRHNIYHKKTGHIHFTMTYMYLNDR